MKKPTDHDNNVRFRTRSYPINKPKRASTATNKNAPDQEQESLLVHHFFIYAAEPDLFLILCRKRSPVSKTGEQPELAQIAKDPGPHPGDEVIFLNLSKNKVHGGKVSNVTCSKKVKVHDGDSSRSKAFRLINEIPNNPLVKDLCLKISSKKLSNLCNLPSQYKLMLEEYHHFQKVFNQWKADRWAKDTIQT